jgi:hypothetical protein
VGFAIALPTLRLLHEYFFGIIDELRIYNRALSDFEIQNLYRLNF